MLDTVKKNCFFNKILQRKNFFSRVKDGFLAGWSIEILPPYITNIDNNRYTRLFKMVGGISMFFIVSGIGAQFNKFSFNIAVVLSLFYIFYKLVLTFYVLKQWFLNLRSGKFLHRNSPLDKTATLIRASTATLRSAAKFTAGTGFTFALCYELDEILVSEGKEPYFVPGMRTVIVSSGCEENAKAFLNKLGIKDRVNNPDLLDAHINNVSEEDKKVFETETKVSWNDYKNLHRTAVALKHKKSSTVSELIYQTDPFGKKKK